jgi:hypothetical protein
MSSPPDELLLNSRTNIEAEILTPASIFAINLLEDVNHSNWNSSNAFQFIPPNKLTLDAEHHQQ